MLQFFAAYCISGFLALYVVCGMCHAAAAYHILHQRILISINQSIKFLYRQYPWRSQAQWRNSQIGVQIQSRWSYSVTSAGRWAHRCLWGGGGGSPSRKGMQNAEWFSVFLQQTLKWKHAYTSSVCVATSTFEKWTERFDTYSNSL